MTKNMNRQVAKIIQNFIIDQNTGSARQTEYQIEGKTYYSVETKLFQYIDDQKHVVGYLMGKGYDPFKRGTKEPLRIEEALKSVRWDDVKDAPKFGKSMWD